MAQADREKTCGTCRNNDTYHCADCENKSDYEQSQAEVNAYAIQSALNNGTNTVIGTAQSDTIPREAVKDVSYDGGDNWWVKNMREQIKAQADGDLTTALCSLPKIQSSDGQEYVQLYDVLETVRRYMPSVAIPPDHDGCEDCRWQSQSEIEMPCKQCMHNYTDEWERAKTGHWIEQPSNKEQGERDFVWWKCSECGQVIYSETEKDRREYHAFCGRCGKRMER